MNYMDLKTEIETGPFAAQLAGKSDDGVAALLNDTGYSRAIRTRFISARTLLAELPGGADILDKLEAAGASSAPVKWAMLFLKSDGIDIGHPATIAQIDTLAAASVITADEADALKGLALQPASRAEVLGWPPITYNDVNAARAL